MVTFASRPFLQSETRYGEDRRAQGPDPADARRHAGKPEGRTHHDGAARRTPRGLGGGSLPALLQQGADVRGPDRVHRADRLHPGEPDPGGREGRDEADRVDDRDTARLRPEEPGNDPRAHWRCAGERGRTPADTGEPAYRPPRGKPPAERAPRRER